jgi:hypothetical protein
VSETFGSRIVRFRLPKVSVGRGRWRCDRIVAGS